MKLFQCPVKFFHFLVSFPPEEQAQAKNQSRNTISKVLWVSKIKQQKKSSPALNRPLVHPQAPPPPPRATKVLSVNHSGAAVAAPYLGFVTSPHAASSLLKR